MAIISKNTIVWELLDKVTGPLDRIGESTGKTKQALEAAKFTIQTSGSDLVRLGDDAGTSARRFHDSFQKIDGSAKEGTQGIKDFVQGTSALKTAQEKIHDVTDAMDKMPHEKTTKLSVVAEDGKAREFREQVDKTPRDRETTFRAKTSDAISKIKGLGNEEEELGHKSTKLKDILLGTFAGNLIAGGIAAITGKLHEAIQAGEEYNKEQDTMKTVWRSLTEEAPQDGKQLIDFINDVGQHSIYASENVNKMAQSFYHVHSNVAETKQWTNDFVALGSTLHMTGDQVSEAAEMFAKMQASGKVGAEDMAVMINRFPMFGEAVQKSSGKTMQELYKLSSQGKLSADVFAKALDDMGDKYKKSTSEAMGSAQGMGMYISSRMAKLSGDVQKSSFELSKGVQHDIQSILSDGSLERMANGISKALGGMMTGVSHVVSYIADHKGTIVDIIGNLKTIIGIFASTVWDTAKSIISDVAAMFGKLSGSAGKSQDPLKNVNTILKEIADHKEAIQAFAKVMLGLFAVKKATAFASSINGVSKAIGLLPDAEGKIGILGKAFSKIGGGAASLAKTIGGGLASAFKALGAALLGNPIFLAAAAIVALGVAFYEAYKHIKPFHDAINGIGSAIKKGLGSAINFVKKDWKEIGLLLVNPIAGATALLYKHNPKFKKWADDLIGDVKEVFTKGVTAIKKDIVKPVKKHWENMQDDINDFKKAAGKTFEKFQDETEKTFTSWRKNVGKSVSQFRDDLENKIQNARDRGSKLADQLHDNMTATFESLRKNTGAKFSAIRSFVTDHMEGARSKGTSLAGRLHDGVMGWWESLRKGTINKWQSMLDFVASIPGKMGSALSNGAHFVGDGAKSIANYMIGKIGDGVNGVISGIDWVLDKVNAPKSLKIKKWDVPKFATGGTHRGGLMMVNDGDGPELVRHPDGRMEIPRGRDVIMNAEPGTQVLNHQDTRAFAKKFGIPMYASGIGDFFSNVWDGIKDIGEDVADAVEHPIKFVEHAIAKHVNLDATHPVLDIGVGAVKKMTEGAMDWIKDKISQFGETSGSFDGSMNANGVFQYLVDIAQKAIKKFDMTGGVTSGYRPGDPYGHGHHMAIDVAYPSSMNGSKKYFDPANWVFEHFPDKIGYVITQGKVRARTGQSGQPATGQWEPWPDNDHYDHLHINGKLGSGDIFKAGGNGGGGQGAPGGSGVERWRGQVKQALAANGLPTSESYVSAWLRQIATESSGNENAVQGGYTDVNTLSGDLAKGLLQTISATFNAYKFPGHGNIFNGYDNILAAINYAKSRYGSDMLGVIGQGHGYQEGGNPKTRQLAWLAEDGEEFVINPRKPNALSLAFNALQSIEREQPALAGVSQYDYNPGSYGGADGQRMAANAGKQSGSWINDKLERIIDRLETIANKDSDVYIDGDKLTDRVNRKNTDRLDILQTIN